ncbi:prepilin-type N-terminal cleavage/methylation domain-containing protein [Acidobacteriota bacterium]
MLKDRKGFTLIELLIVVAIIGIIAAIAIPNLLNAIQRGKQKRTMSDMRSVGTSVESYQVDNGFPVRDGTSRDDIVNIEIHLEPTYIKILPLDDAWKNRMHYYGVSDEYTIWSYGKDGGHDGADAQGVTRSFACDIIFANGQFVKYPEGSQQ